VLSDRYFLSPAILKVTAGAVANKWRSEVARTSTFEVRGFSVNTAGWRRAKQAPAP